MTDTIKKSGIRDVLQNEHNLNVGSDVYEAADEALKELLENVLQGSWKKGSPVFL